MTFASHPAEPNYRDICEMRFTGGAASLSLFEDFFSFCQNWINRLLLFGKCNQAHLTDRAKGKRQQSPVIKFASNFTDYLSECVHMCKSAYPYLSHSRIASRFVNLIRFKVFFREWNIEESMLCIWFVTAVIIHVCDSYIDPRHPRDASPFSVNEITVLMLKLNVTDWKISDQRKYRWEDFMCVSFMLRTVALSACIASDSKGMFF